jgi:hypothetical protein
MTDSNRIRAFDNEKADVSLDRRSLDEKIDTSSDGSIDLRHGDEALQLIDAEKVIKFSEEYNLKLRRKLVSSSGASYSAAPSSFPVGLSDTTHLWRGVLHTVSVSRDGLMLSLV